jgi:hypothetical protein
MNKNQRRKIMTTNGSKYRGTKEYHLVFFVLIAAAQSRGVVPHTKIAPIIGINQPGHHMAQEVGQLLGEISEDEHQNGRPMLSAVVVSEWKGLLPGEGFFKLARKLGKTSANDATAEKQFWISERDAVYDCWSEDS